MYKYYLFIIVFLFAQKSTFAQATAIDVKSLNITKKELIPGFGYKITVDGKVGLMNKTEKYLIVEPKYHDIYTSRKRFIEAYDKENDTVALIDTNTNLIHDNIAKILAHTSESVVIQTKEEEILLYTPAFKFVTLPYQSVGYANHICYQISENHLLGLMDDWGNVVVKPQYKKMFQEGKMAMVFFKDDQDCALYDLRKLQYVADGGYRNFSNIYKTEFFGEKKDSTYYFNLDNGVVKGLPYKYMSNDYHYYKKRMYSGIKNSETYVLDSNFNIAFHSKFFILRCNLNDDVFIARKTENPIDPIYNHIGVVNKKNKILVPFEDSFINFEGGLIVKQKEHTTMIYNQKGKLLKKGEDMEVVIGKKYSKVTIKKSYKEYFNIMNNKNGKFLLKKNVEELILNEKEGWYKFKSQKDTKEDFEVVTLKK